jgi:hypothetical protein
VIVDQIDGPAHGVYLNSIVVPRRPALESTFSCAPMPMARSRTPTSPRWPGFTEMGCMRDELNVGQLCRERFADDSALIGFGTHTGTAAAAPDWEEPMQVMRVRPSRADSYGQQFHLAGVCPGFVDLRPGQNDALHEALREERVERFIGVIYRPDTELYSHYAEVELPAPFDAFVWFDTRTRAVQAIEASGDTRETPETFPFGLTSNAQNEQTTALAKSDAHNLASAGIGLRTESRVPCAMHCELA